MSYILNALRKSEQARQSIQPDAPNASALLPEITVTQRKWWPMIAVFLSLNLLGLGYLYFKLADPVSVNVTAIETPTSVMVHQNVLKSVAVNTSPVISTIEKTPNTLAISDLWAENQKAQQVANALKLPVLKPKPVVKKPLPIVSLKKLPTKVPVEKKLINPFAVVHDEMNEMPETARALPIEPPKQTSDIPLLRDLREDFQARIPVTTINVLAYADLPHDRFVIIDMTKYKIGERIKAKVQLVDILPESVIMAFEGQRFRLERH